MRVSVRLLTILLLLVCVCSVQATNMSDNVNNPTTSSMTIQEKRSIRKELLPALIDKYENNQTFFQMHSYMINKFNEKKRKGTPTDPDELIVETFEKTNNLFDKVRSFIGSSFTKQYDPIILEKNFNKYLWLKGICFTFLGVKEEHKIAVSFFYQPENEALKREFMIDVVKFSFPEVMDIPQNQFWFIEMGTVMERIAYKAFNAEKYSIPSK